MTEAIRTLGLQHFWPGMQESILDLSQQKQELEEGVAQGLRITVSLMFSCSVPDSFALDFPV